MRASSAATPRRFAPCWRAPGSAPSCTRRRTCSRARATDRALEGLLAYGAEIGATHAVYHAHALPDHPASEDRLLAETRSLARLAARAERLGVTIALENLAPTYPREELLSDKPLVLRALGHRIGSPRVGLCLDVGHAHVVAELKHTALDHLVFPALDTAVLFHLHDNLGARWNGSAPPELDPVRLDLHLAPGEGTVPWESIAPALASHGAPLMLEVPPFRRPEPAELHAAARRLLAPAPPAPLRAA